MSNSLLGEREARINVNYLATLDFIISLGFGLILPLFPIYVSRMGGGGLEVGILFASFVLTRALLAAPFGNLSDKIGRKRIILIGSSLYAVLAVLFTVPEDWWGLIFVRGFQGVASAMVWPVSEALVIDSSPVAKRGFSLSKIVLASNLGMMIGPFVGGALFYTAFNILHFSETDSFKFPFYFTSVLAFGGFVMAWARVTDAKAPERAPSKMTFRKLLRPDGTDAQDRRNLKALYVNAMMEGFAFSSIGPLMVLFLSFRFTDLGADAISIIIGSAMGVGALFTLSAGRLADKTSRKRQFVLGGYMAFIGTILVPFGWTLWLIIAFLALRSLAFQVSAPALRALQADTVPETVRGRLIGMLESMSNFGSVLGAPIGGVMWDYFHGRDLGFGTAFDGTVLPFLISGILGLLAVTMVQMLVKERVPHVHPPEPDG